MLGDEAQSKDLLDGRRDCNLFALRILKATSSRDRRNWRIPSPGHMHSGWPLRSPSEAGHHSLCEPPESASSPWLEPQRRPPPNVTKTSASPTTCFPLRKFTSQHKRPYPRRSQCQALRRKVLSGRSTVCIRHRPVSLIGKHPVERRFIQRLAQQGRVEKQDAFVAG